MRKETRPLAVSGVGEPCQSATTETSLKWCKKGGFLYVQKKNFYPEWKSKSTVNQVGAIDTRPLTALVND